MPLRVRTRSTHREIPRSFAAQFDHVADTLPWIDVFLSLAVGIGLAAAVGLRVFVPLLVLGGASRLGWITLQPDFLWLASNAGLVALSAATVLEVAAYYIPAIDNAFDVIAGPAAVVAGILAIAAVSGDLPPVLRWSLALIAGGGTAGFVQGLTTIARLKSTGFTGGLANPILATFELVGSAGVAVLALTVPLFAIAFVVVLVFAIRHLRRRNRPAH